MNERTISNTGDANDRGRELAWSEGNDEADRSVMRALHRNRDRMPIDHTGVRRNVLGALAQGGVSAGGSGTGFAGGVATKIVASIAGLALLGGGLLVFVDTPSQEGAASSNRGLIPMIEHSAPEEISMPSTRPTHDVGSLPSSTATPSTSAKNDVRRELPNTSSAQEIINESVTLPTSDIENDRHEPTKPSDQTPVYTTDGAEVDVEINAPTVSRRKP